MSLFQHILADSQQSGRKLLHAYNRWKEELVKAGREIGAEEFEYAMRRLNRLNSTADPARGFNKGFWFYEKKKLGIA